MFDTEKDIWSLAERPPVPNRPGAGATADTSPTHSNLNESAAVPLAIDQIEAAPDLLLEQDFSGLR
jgi:hypothetical protein